MWEKSFREELLTQRTESGKWEGLKKGLRALAKESEELKRLFEGAGRTVSRHGSAGSSRHGVCYLQHLPVSTHARAGIDWSSCQHSPQQGVLEHTFQ